MEVPGTNARLGRWLVDKVIEPCRVSVDRRMAQARSIRQWLYTGSDNENYAIFNKLGIHCDRLASNLYSPADLRFYIEYENDYGPDLLKQAAVAARYLTREFMRRDLDVLFGEGVELAVPFGAAVLKSLWGNDGLGARLVMPWQMGVYREDETSLDQQEAIVETTRITEQQFWRRISHRADAAELLKRARAHARRQAASDVVPDGGIFQIALSGSSPMIQDAGSPSQPGGSIDVTDPGAATLSPEIAASLLTAHECYVVNDATGDYSTFQLVEPDIVIHPRSIRNNLFVQYQHPYTLIRVNPQPGYIWGRSEIADLVMLQAFLRDRLFDIKEMMNLQYDGRYAFVGFSGINDDRYDEFKRAGWIANENPGGKVEKLTPELPAHSFEEFGFYAKLFEESGGFDNVLSGRGEAGVRSGNHFQGLLRTSSPRLRDRSIRVERSVAAFGEKCMWLMDAKDPRAHWTRTNDPQRKSDFVFATLPDDARVLVDSHSASPIYEQDHANLAAFLKKDGDIDGEDVLDLLPVPNRDNLKEKLRLRDEAKQQFIQSLPPDLKIEAMLGHRPNTGRRR